MLFKTWYEIQFIRLLLSVATTGNNTLRGQRAVMVLAVRPRETSCKIDVTCNLEISVTF